MKRSERLAKLDKLDTIILQIKRLNKNILKIDELSEFFDLSDKAVIERNKKAIIERALSKGDTLITEAKKILDEIDWTHDEEDVEE